MISLWIGTDQTEAAVKIVLSVQCLKAPRFSDMINNIRSHRYLPIGSAHELRSAGCALYMHRSGRR